MAGGAEPSAGRYTRRAHQYRGICDDQASGEPGRVGGRYRRILPLSRTLLFHNPHYRQIEHLFEVRRHPAACPVEA